MLFELIDRIISATPVSDKALQQPKFRLEYMYKTHITGFLGQESKKVKLVVDKVLYSLYILQSPTGFDHIENIVSSRLSTHCNTP